MRSKATPTDFKGYVKHNLSVETSLCLHSKQYLEWDSPAIKEQFCQLVVKQPEKFVNIWTSSLLNSDQHYPFPCQSEIETDLTVARTDRRHMEKTFWFNWGSVKIIRQQHEKVVQSWSFLHFQVLKTYKSKGNRKYAGYERFRYDKCNKNREVVLPKGKKLAPMCECKREFARMFASRTLFCLWLI